jgi:ankyrin repeat protein
MESMFECSICKEIALSLYVCTDGHSYHKSCIEQWLSIKRISPITKANVSNKVTVNMFTRGMIEVFLKKGIKFPLPKSYEKEDEYIIDLLVKYKKLNRHVYTHILSPRLVLACKQNNLDTVMHLLRNKYIDYNQIDEDGNTSLMYAIENRLVEVAMILLKKPDIDYTRVCENGYTALLSACAKNMPQIALELDRPNIDHNQVNQFEDSALIWACVKEMQDIAMILINKPDINYNQVNKRGSSALFWACQNKMNSIALALLEKPDIKYNQVSEGKYTILMAACANNMTDVALKLLDKPDINYDAIDNKKVTALSLAIKNNMFDVVNVINELRLPTLGWAMKFNYKIRSYITTHGRIHKTDV